MPSSLPQQSKSVSQGYPGDEHVQTPWAELHISLQHSEAELDPQPPSLRSLQVGCGAQIPPLQSLRAGGCPPQYVRSGFPAQKGGSVVEVAGGGVVLEFFFLRFFLRRFFACSGFSLTKLAPPATPAMSKPRRERL
jgi:hypothetical protein